MRSRPFVPLVLAVSSICLAVSASAQQSDPLADGLTRGAYVRLSGGSVSPLNAQGSFKDWEKGMGINLNFENWDNGGGGVGRFGFGVFLDYSMLPFDDQQFIADFTNGPNGRATSATANRAGIFQLGVTTRIRIPAPYIMPSIGVGFGFLDWRPGKITYTAGAPSASFTAKQQNRTGGAITIMGGLDKHIYDRWAIFAEALYSYAYTSFGQGLGASGSSCVATNCDLLKNTQLGTIRGGIRVRASN
jgi:opacity protein-like surface antigen